MEYGNDTSVKIHNKNYFFRQIFIRTEDKFADEVFH